MRELKFLGKKLIMYNFTIIIKKPEDLSCLYDIDSVFISNILLLCKPSKDIKPFVPKKTLSRTKDLKVTVSKNLAKFGGSHRYPRITFKGKHLVIKVENFPRYPCFCQDKYDARNNIKGGHQDKSGFDDYTNTLIEFKNIKKHEKKKSPKRTHL